MIAAIDPGIHGCGVALFTDAGQLGEAGYIPNPASDRAKPGFRYSAGARAVRSYLDGFRFRRGVDAISLEVPQIYREAGNRKRDPNDLIPLAQIGAAVAAFMDVNPTTYRPHDWKGNIGWEELTRRVREILTAAEFERVDLPSNSCAVCAIQFPGLKDCTKPASCLAHNVWDAVGIGLFTVGRYPPERIIPR